MTYDLAVDCWTEPALLAVAAVVVLLAEPAFVSAFEFAVAVGIVAAVVVLSVVVVVVVAHMDFFVVVVEHMVLDTFVVALVVACKDYTSDRHMEVVDNIVEPSFVEEHHTHNHLDNHHKLDCMAWSHMGPFHMVDIACIAVASTVVADEPLHDCLCPVAFHCAAVVLLLVVVAVHIDSNIVVEGRIPVVQRRMAVVE